MAAVRPGPRRVVVDQVCLVPDVAAFLEAIALWDERSFLPDPDRRTRLDVTVPACVSSRAGGAFPGGGPSRVRAEALYRLIDSARLVATWVWSRALEAVARAWSGPIPVGARCSRPPIGLLEGSVRTPPGLVLSAPEAPMLAGAVALAAGHFQPLVRLQAPGEEPGTSQETSSTP